jgi:uncharacterized protein (DUF1778 family)
VMAEDSRDQAIWGDRDAKEHQFVRARRASTVGRERTPTSTYAAIRADSLNSSLVRLFAVHYGRSKDGIVAHVRHIGRPPRKEERLEARVVPDQKRLVECAAALRGTSVKEFVVASAQAAATSTIKQFDILRLRDQAREVFINAVLNPPSPNDAVRAAAKRYGRNMER